MPADIEVSVFSAEGAGEIFVSPGFGVWQSLGKLFKPSAESLNEVAGGDVGMVESTEASVAEQRRGVQGSDTGMPCTFRDPVFNVEKQSKYHIGTGGVLW